MPKQELSAGAAVRPFTTLSVVMQNTSVEYLFLQRHPFAEKIILIERSQVPS
jgi:hypothetical protein